MRRVVPPACPRSDDTPPLAVQLGSRHSVRLSASRRQRSGFRCRTARNANAAANTPRNIQGRLAAPIPTTIASTPRVPMMRSRGRTDNLGQTEPDAAHRSNFAVCQSGTQRRARRGSPRATAALHRARPSRRIARAYSPMLTTNSPVQTTQFGDPFDARTNAVSLHANNVAQHRNENARASERAASSPIRGVHLAMRRRVDPRHRLVRP